MSNKRNIGKILNWERGLNQTDDDFKISYSNQNGVSGKPEAKYSLNDINGFSQKDNVILNIIKIEIIQ